MSALLGLFLLIAVFVLIAALVPLVIAPVVLLTMYLHRRSLTVESDVAHEPRPATAGRKSFKLSKIVKAA
ncbi:hypothetical protein [Luteococcus sp. OSA5]|uniref:hypothetical protein n=1 Tax=Luteococcus sp. OSA5 TaxID=3401630 RepID=UPI003B43A67C